MKWEKKIVKKIEKKKEKKIKNVPYFKQIKLDLLFISGILVAFAILCLFSYAKKDSQKLSINELRITYKEVVKLAENHEYEKLKIYPCAIINTDSEVVFSTIPEYQEKDSVNLHALSTSDQDLGRYLVPLIEQQKQTGTLLIEYDAVKQKKLSSLILISFLISLVIIGLLCLHICDLLNRKVTEPVIAMCKQADNILKYEYDTQLGQCDRSELGELCNKMELIRFELRRAEESEKKLKEREENLLASISHDLRTPITTISGCAEGIKSGLANTPETLNHYADTIIMKSQLLNRMIESMLESSTIGMNDYIVHKKEVYLKPYLEKIITDMDQDLSQHGLFWGEIIIEDFLVLIDPDLIYEVVQNIIGNAVKYTNVQGKISIKTQKMKNRNEVMVEISDNGQGIKAEDIPFIFDKFFRGEKARTQSIPGNGLGLSIVKSIITLHGGIVECESILGKGTTIAFSLPLA